MSYCIYLRKSRKDEELDKEETLQRHEKTLLSLAKNKDLPISKIYKEIVSGDTIAKRPEMQNLLNDVSNGIYKGVIVMEVERLARGNTIDQGIVAETFKFSNTKIITPNKVYDPNNEFDEEYFEFGLFMARREYKVINRRLQRGRIASVKEGNYIGSIAPYGYNKVKIDKNHTLEINKEQAEIVKLIFDLYTNKNIGVSKIANHLNSLGIKPIKSDVWVNSTIQTILKNPIYIGKIKWNERATVNKMINGNVKKTRPRAKEYILVNGIHKPIISTEQFEKTKNIMNNSNIIPLKKEKGLKNPLASIIKCGYCGRNMIRRPYTKNGQKDTLMCSVVACNNISSPLHIVEEKLFKMIDEYIMSYKLDLDKNKNNSNKEKDTLNTIIKSLENEKNKIQLQLNNLHDLLEQGIYNTNTFLERSKILNNNLKDINIKLDNTYSKFNKIQKPIEMDNFITKLENLKEKYTKEKDINTKNNLLKEVIDYAIYRKNKNCRWHNNLEDFELIIYPKVPQ